MPRQSRSLYFTGPRALTIRDDSVAEPGHNEVLVAAVVSGISAGTELNVYRGLAPQWRQQMDPVTRLFSDANGSDWSWPARYGYASVGRVAQTGSGVSRLSVGDWVFSYSPHGTHAVVPEAAVVPLLSLSNPENGVFYANLNTAYNGVLDGNFALGADVVVTGLGVIGQLVLRLARRAGARRVIAVDGIAQRRDFALAGGATHVIDPSGGGVAEEVRALTDGRGADCVFEVSGAAPALNEAIRIVGYNGTVVAMSWYGGTFESLSLSGEFHHNRPRIISSQVAMVNPALGPLWSVKRRGEITLELLETYGADLQSFVSHRMPLTDAANAYRLLDQGSPDVMQILLDYSA